MDRLSDLIIKHGPYRVGDAADPELMRRLLTAAGLNELRAELSTARKVAAGLTALAGALRNGAP